MCLGCDTVRAKIENKVAQMGAVRVPEPAMGLVAMIYKDPSCVEQAAEMLSRAVGPVQEVEKPHPFRFTDYYQKEMGIDLWRGFLKTEKLLERELLVDFKLLTNRLEQKLARPDAARRINLDPGLLTADNLVLATTKNRAHRVYLRSGIFAEVTLWYVRGGFEPLEWTYPDYRSIEIRSLLERLRKEYMYKLRHGSPSVLSSMVEADEHR